MKQLIDYWWSAWNVSIVFTIRFFDNYMNGRYDVVLALTLKIKKHCSFCCIGVGHFHSGSSQNEPNDTLSPSVGRWRTGGSMCMARRFAISSLGAMWGNAIHWKCLLEALPQQTMVVLGFDWNFINLMQKNMDNKPPWWAGPTGIGVPGITLKKVEQKIHQHKQFKQNTNWCRELECPAAFDVWFIFEKFRKCWQQNYQGPPKM